MGFLYCKRADKVSDVNKNRLRVIIFLLLFFVLFRIVQNIFIPKTHSLITIEDFYSLENDSVDIAFFGSSHIVNGVNPNIVSDITGYSVMNYAIKGQVMQVHRDYIEEMYKKQSPGLVIIDIFRFRTNEYVIPPVSDSHKSFDGLKTSLLKLKSVVYSSERGDIKELILPLYRYHTRWEELDIKDFLFAFGRRESSNRGFEPLDIVEPQTMPEVIQPNLIELSEETKDCLDSIVSMLSKHDSMLLMINLPYAHFDSHDWGVYTAVDKYLTELCIQANVGYKYIDYNVDKDRRSVINYEEDFLDISHLNNNGASKLSRDLGKYINHNYSGRLR